MKTNFSVMFLDDVIEPTAVMGEMIRVRQEQGGSVLLAVKVDPAHVSSYGVFDIEATDDDRVKKVVGMVEKPGVEYAASNLVATGRYLLDCAIFAPLAASNPARAGSCSLPAPSLSSFPRDTPFASWCMMACAMTSAIPPASFPERRARAPPLEVRPSSLR